MNRPHSGQVTRTSPTTPPLPGCLSILRSPCALTAISIDNAGALTTAPLDPNAELHRSWRHLSAVRTAGPDTLFHALVILLETVPDLSTSDATPRLPSGWGEPPAPVPATSAHPRAYQGTRYRPPKASAAEPLDVRPLLCHRRSLRSLLAPLRPHLDAALRRLRRHGYPDEVLAALEREMPWLRVPDAPSAAGCWAMPARFVQCLWPAVRRRPARAVAHCLSLYSSLGLDRDDALLAATARLLALASSEHSLAWCAIAVLLPPARRLEFLQAAIDTGVTRAAPSATSAADIEAIAALTTDEHFPSWVNCYLEHAREARPTGYLLSGLRLAAQFSPHALRGPIGCCDRFPEDVVEEIGIAFADEPWFPCTLWDRCGAYPGLDSLLRQSAWRDWEPDAARRYLHLFSELHYSDRPARTVQSKWRSVRACLPQFEAFLGTVPRAYQAKAAGYFADWLQDCDEPAAIQRRFVFLIDLIRRLAAPPQSVSDAASGILGSLLAIEDDALLPRVLAAPRRSFEILERASRRRNDGNLIAWGLYRIARHLPALTLDALHGAPRKLLRAARTLGGVRPAVRREICCQCAATPLFRLDLTATPLRDAATVIAEACRPSFTNPIPARLRLWLQDRVELSPDSLERFRRVIASRLVSTRLDALQDAVLTHLQAGLPPQTPSPAGRHALRLLGDVRENRRGLRKFLHAWWSGDRSYLARHPATAAWYRKHPALPRRVWENGIPSHALGAAFTIEVERDPFEILKLGAYAGTCLGIGGLCSDSAIAALLDANKRVLYARDPRGRVLARQLLAIADDDRLVTFEVYPRSGPTPIKEAFRAYDRAFAQALGIPIYISRGDDDPGYTVSPVLAVYWWDDGAWDVCQHQ